MLVGRPGKYIQYYKEHSNPHSIKYTTYIHRISLLGRPMEKALCIPYMGRGGDRKTIKYIEQITVINPPQVMIEFGDANPLKLKVTSLDDTTATVVII